MSKNNIDPAAVRSIPANEMAILLGVEYVLYGTYDLVNEGTNTYGSGVTTFKEKEDKSRYQDKTKGTAVTSSSTSTRVDYETKVDLTIYSDQGSNVYSDSKKPFSGSVDSYSSSIDYLIKRTPFGSKAK